jgi:four helix bundle protein
LFGLVSQLRRASISVPLNIVEGYARQSAKSQAQFLNIAYGSLKESQFIIGFAIEENYISAEFAKETLLLGEEIARMVWTKTKTLRAKQ